MLIYKICKYCKIKNDINKKCKSCNDDINYVFICEKDNKICCGIIICDKITIDEKEELINKIHILNNIK